MKSRRLSHALGVEVSELNLVTDLGTSEMADLRALWAEHLLIVFPRQQLTGADMLRIANAFVGSSLAELHPERTAGPCSAGMPIVGEWDGYKDGHNWHSDKSFTTEPTAGTMLYCHATPVVGGDTMFANMYTAYESLSPKMRGIVETLSAVHVRNLRLRPLYRPTPDGSDTVHRSIAEVERRHSASGVASVHPIVLIHPETQRKALYVGSRIDHIVGMRRAESDAMVRFLSEHAATLEFTYRHHWDVHDLVLWDNRCLLHMALCDYDVERERREFTRCVIVGEAGSEPLDFEDDRDTLQFES